MRIKTAIWSNSIVATFGGIFLLACGGSSAAPTLLPTAEPTMAIPTMTAPITLPVHTLVSQPTDTPEADAAELGFAALVACLEDRLRIDVIQARVTESRGRSRWDWYTMSPWSCV